MQIAATLLRVQFVDLSPQATDADVLAEWDMPCAPREGETFIILPQDGTALVFTIKRVAYVPQKKAVLVYGLPSVMNA